MPAEPARTINFKREKSGGEINKGVKLLKEPLDFQSGVLERNYGKPQASRFNHE